MSDSLRTLVERYDKARARRNRLTDAVVLPVRPDAAVRRVCGSCWHVVDEAAERTAFRERIGCEVGTGWNWQDRCCYGHWHKHGWHVHKFLPITRCPSCDADDLHEVTP